MTTSRLLPFIVVALVTTPPGVGQESKPGTAEPKDRLVEATVLGRKVTLSVPADWRDHRPATLPAMPPGAAPWKLAGCWGSEKNPELTIALYGVEKAGITATKLRDDWLAHARTRGTAGFVVKADVKDPKDKALTGHDLELDLKTGDEKFWYWLRPINLGKDRVAVLYAEANPLKPIDLSPLIVKMETFVREEHVLAIGRIMASFLKKAANPNDAWVCGPTYEISRGGATVKAQAPKGWEYTRLGPEGSVIWMKPGEPAREYIIGLDDIPDRDSAMKHQAERMVIERMGGKVYKDQDLVGGRYEFISASSFGGDRPIWQWRRVYGAAGVTISILAKVPVSDVAVEPSDVIQKEAKGFLDGIKIGP